MLKQSIITPKKYLKFKKTNLGVKRFIAPKIILICYQKNPFRHLLEHNPNAKNSKLFPNLYVLNDNKVGILGDWGFGAPTLALKMESFIALGTKSFVSIGLAGTLTNQQQIGDFVKSQQALAEDGVSRFYLPKNKKFAEADKKMISDWNVFAKKSNLPTFKNTSAWSFSAFFKTSLTEIRRVNALGCDIIEMESATLHAIGREKSVQTLSLFVISDSIIEGNWIAYTKKTTVQNNLNKLADWALQFCKKSAID